MSHARFDENARKALTACVKEIETRTDAELVLVIRARSDSYRHADYLFGALLAFVWISFPHLLALHLPSKLGSYRDGLVLRARRLCVISQ